MVVVVSPLELTVLGNRPIGRQIPRVMAVVQMRARFQLIWSRSRLSTVERLIMRVRV